MDFNINCLDIDNMTCKEVKNIIKNVKSNYENIEKDNIDIIIENLKKDKRKNVRSLGLNLIKYIEKRNIEIKRIKSMYDFDRDFGDYKYLAGVDEVGRGPLAGPIVAGAVILDLDYYNDKDLILGIKDSKKLSSKKREELSKIIKDRARSYSISLINNDKIDEVGIGWANNQVLKRAALGLEMKPDLVLSDGYIVKNFNIENKFIIKGDAKSINIAGASIIAKVYRDNLMKEYSKIYPQYMFEHNMGYGTKEHIHAIKKYGPCKIHRVSFLKNIL